MRYIKFLVKKILLLLDYFLGSPKKIKKMSGDINNLYQILYYKVQDLQNPEEFNKQETLKTFNKQWKEYPVGYYLLSDPWFKQRVTDILSSQEILLKKEWFKGKKILDAGCGNGRWSYGFSKMQADLTAVDGSENALQITEEAIKEFNNSKKFILTPLEELDQKVEKESFDLVFSWGVLHHCKNFEKAFLNVSNCVKKGGLIYMYLYGRETLPIDKDIEVFKDRVAYNLLTNEEERYNFLMKKCSKKKMWLHGTHDFYAPLINRRFEFDEIKNRLENLGYKNIIRTIVLYEIHIRATKGEKDYS